MFELLGVVGGIVLVDLVLSGDNVLVIGAAAAALPRQQRWLAIILGGGGAIILRLILAVGATSLLRLPLIQAFGGILLLLIAIRLLAARQEKRPTGSGEAASQQVEMQKPTTSRLPALLLTIILADLTMSLDNVLAVGALAHGNLPLLAVGILLSIVILLLGSVIVAELIGRLSWLLDIAALVLAWTGANMVLDDLRLGPWLGRYPWTQLVIPTIAFAVVLIADVLLRLRKNATQRVERPVF